MAVFDACCRSVAELSARRYEFAAASLAGKLYFAGGNPGDGHGDPTAGARVDVFDAATRAWTTAELPTARDRLAAGAIASRGIVCFGGGHDLAVIECLKQAK